MTLLQLYFRIILVGQRFFSNLDMLKLYSEGEGGVKIRFLAPAHVAVVRTVSPYTERLLVDSTSGHTPKL